MFSTCRNVVLVECRSCTCLSKSRSQIRWICLRSFTICHLILATLPTSALSPRRDAAIISIADMLTSLLAGFVIFGILGNLAHELDTTVDQVIKGGGTSLAFVSYPQALANFPGVPQVSQCRGLVNVWPMSVSNMLGHIWLPVG